jgi:hypothetical protein
MTVMRACRLGANRFPYISLESKCPRSAHSRNENVEPVYSTHETPSSQNKKHERVWSHTPRHLQCTKQSAHNLGHMNNTLTSKKKRDIWLSSYWGGTKNPYSARPHDHVRYDTTLPDTLPSRQSGEKKKKRAKCNRCRDGEKDTWNAGYIQTPSDRHPFISVQYRMVVGVSRDV